MSHSDLPYGNLTNIKMRWRAANELHDGIVANVAKTCSYGAPAPRRYDELALFGKWLYRRKFDHQAHSYVRAQFARYLDLINRFADTLVISVPGVIDIYNDLETVAKEFPESCWRDGAIHVRSKHLSDDGVEFGRFDLMLYITASGCSFLAEPEEPNFAVCNTSEVSHPHVKDSLICMGDALCTAKTAALDGRIADVFRLINSGLENINYSGAYCQPSAWGGDNDLTQCDSCGYEVDLDSVRYCESCCHNVCNDCYRSCDSCGDAACNNCVTYCSCDRECYCGSCQESERCNDCASLLCRKCKVECVCCKAVLCKECICSCSTCGDVCDSCVTKCDTCGVEGCTNCIIVGLCEDCVDENERNRIAAEAASEVSGAECCT